MDWTTARYEMLKDLHRYGIRDERVLSAMETVPRHLFIPTAFRHSGAYADHPCPIGHQQTISQPFIVAYMTQLLQISPGDRVLDIGAGSGYQAAVLAELGAEVFTIEVIEELANHAADALKKCGYSRVRVHLGDGHEGCPEHAPFQGILAGCSPASLPEKLPEQLAEGGRLVMPVGESHQRIIVIQRQGERLVRKDDLAVRFVPMVRAK